MKTTALLSLFSFLVLPSIVHAQDPAGPPPPAEPMAMPTSEPASVSASTTPVSTDLLSKEGWSTKIVDRPIGLSAGMLEVDVPFVSSLSKNAVGKPVNIPLAVYYGVTNEFQLSLHHATGLCVSGKDNNCAKAYNDLGLRGTYSILGRGSSFELAGWAQLHAARFSPELALQAIIGPYINWVIAGGKGLILSNPGVVIGLTEREAGNKEQLAVPVYAFLQATDNIAPYLYTGIFSPFEKFGDSYAVPAGVGVFYGVNNRIDVVAEFDFLNLGGKVGDGVSRTDAKQVFVQLNVRPL